jgi:hypothetical protein
VPAVIDDPLLRRVALPYCEEYHPLGFRLELISNSREVHQAAAESWSAYGREFDPSPVQMRVIVEGSGTPAPEPCFRSQGRLLTIVSDRDNHGCLNLDSLFGYAYVTERTAANRAWFRWFFLEAMVYAALAQRYVTPLHAACVARNGVGALLCGSTAAGKSTLAFACARAGFTYISDDAAMLLQDVEGRTVIGKPHQARFRPDAPRFFPELEGCCCGARPNGKVSIEASMRAFPHIRTAARCEIGCLALLERGGGPSLEPAAPEEVLREALRDATYYGPEVQARHEAALARLMQAPAYRLRYDRLEDAVALLKKL